MDTDAVCATVTEQSALAAQPMTSQTSTVAMTCPASGTSVCLLTPESSMSKDTLEDVGLDLTEPFVLGNTH